MWIWSVDDHALRLRRQLDRIEFSQPIIDPVHRQLAMRGPDDNMTRLWSLDWPARSEPVLLRRGETINTNPPAFSPDGKWLATCDGNGLALWPLARPYSASIAGNRRMVFGADGTFVLVGAGSGVDLLPLEGPIPAAGHNVLELSKNPWDIDVSPDGEHFAVSGRDEIVLCRIDGTDPRVLAAEEMSGNQCVTFSPDGRFVATASGTFDPKLAIYRVWDVETGSEVAVLDLPDRELYFGSTFVSGGRLLVATSKGVVAWDVTTGDHETLVDINTAMLAASEDGRRLLVIEMGEGGINQAAAGSPVFFDLDAGTTTRLATHTERPWAIGLSRDGTVAVTQDVDGFVQVGPVTGEEPHRLLGGSVSALGLPEIDPLGRWIASGDTLLPMPDLSKPPLHTLPRAQLIAKLETLTNIRVVRDEDASTGWKLTHEPFQGWETVPSW